MQFERVSLEMIRYWDSQQQPTCAVYFPGGHFCHFYGTKTFGSKELCLYHNHPLFRRNKDQLGSLIPLSNCPLWKDQEHLL